MILSNKRITKVLIRLLGCAHWSAPLLFANIKDRFSGIETHMVLTHLVLISSLVFQELFRFINPYSQLFLVSFWFCFLAITHKLAFSQNIFFTILLLSLFHFLPLFKSSMLLLWCWTLSMQIEVIWTSQRCSQKTDI